ncbi:MAG: phosphatase PAP2 family protein, partial [Saprospiraceae bacterium]|nr:phosphatase PAP2 family protein [Saprospiraceae bacterium]
AYAHVYVGLHYPLDVLGGGILGWALGWLGFLLYRRGEEKKGSLLNFTGV